MSASRARWFLRAWVTFGVVLLVTAVLVRGVGLHRGPRRAISEEAPSILEPMQLLSRAASTRIDARWLWIATERRELWERCYRRPFEIADCPSFGEWYTSPAGAETALLIAGLTRGSAEEGMTALALIFELARRTQWSVGMLGDSADANELGRLIEGWLTTWAPTSAHDPLLAEPARAAFALWGRVTIAVVDAPVFGTDAAAVSHARVFADELLRSRTAAATDFGLAFAESAPRAAAILLADDDFLVGLAEECSRLFPELDGACGS